MAAKTPLGQHWLNHKPSLEAMTSAACLQAGETVLEIGTGLGALTDELIKTQAQVISLEYDRALYERARKEYSARGIQNLKLLQADVRKFDWQTLQKPYKISANIPYYLCAHLLRSLTDSAHKPSLAVLLLPREVAEKIARTSKRSLLATIVQSHYAITLQQVVGREHFSPPPQVDSQITVLNHCSAFEELAPAEWPLLVCLFKIAFATQRKQLMVNLRQSLNLAGADLSVIFTQADIDLKQRAESLNNDQWWRLFLSLKERL